MRFAYTHPRCIQPQAKRSIEFLANGSMWAVRGAVLVVFALQVVAHKTSRGLLQQNGACMSCAQGSSGVCQGADKVCYVLGADGNCYPATTRCTVPPTKRPTKLPTGVSPRLTCTTLLPLSRTFLIPHPLSHRQHPVAHTGDQRAQHVKYARFCRRVHPGPTTPVVYG